MMDVLAVSPWLVKHVAHTWAETTTNLHQTLWSLILHISNVIQQYELTLLIHGGKKVINGWTDNDKDKGAGIEHKWMEASKRNIVKEDVTSVSTWSLCPGISEPWLVFHRSCFCSLLVIRYKYEPLGNLQACNKSFISVHSCSSSSSLRMVLHKTALIDTYWWWFACAWALSLPNNAFYITKSQHRKDY